MSTVRMMIPRIKLTQSAAAQVKKDSRFSITEEQPLNYIIEVDEKHVAEVKMRYGALEEMNG